jgi:hypothetical protein
MLHSKKILFLFTMLVISQQYQAKDDHEGRFEKWEHRHREHKLTHSEKKAKEYREKADKEDKGSWRQKHYKRIARRYENKAKEERKKLNQK